MGNIPASFVRIAGLSRRWLIREGIFYDFLRRMIPIIAEEYYGLRLCPPTSLLSLASLGAMTVDLIDGRHMYWCVGLGLGLPTFGLYCRKLPRLVNHAIIAVARYRSYCLVKLQRFESLMDRNNVTCWYKRSPGLLASSKHK